MTLTLRRLLLALPAVLAAAVSAASAEPDDAVVALADALRVARADASPPLARRIDAAVRRLDRVDAEFVARAARWLGESRDGEAALAALGVAETVAAAATAGVAEGRVPAAVRGATRAAATLSAAQRRARAALRRVDARAPLWTSVLLNRPSALMSIWVGSGPAPAACVSGAADVAGPQLLRFDGATWTRVPLQGNADLWWVDEVPGDGLWSCGTEGRVVRLDPVTGAAEDLAPPTSATLYGVWGASADEVWTVGVEPGGGAALLRWDGDEWSAAELPPAAQSHGLLKVWGRSADDVLACGGRGTLLHWDGETWSLVPIASAAGDALATDLLTVHGLRDDVVVVGRVFGATIVQASRFGFAESPTPLGTSSLSGVFVPRRGDAWAVGYFGNVLRRTRGRWRDVETAQVPPGTDLHAVRIDDTGGVWIAGGNLFREEAGALLHFGPRRPSRVVAE